MSYERLFSGQEGQVSRLTRFMELDRSPQISKGLRRSRRRHPELRSGEDLPADEIRYIEEHRDDELWSWAQSLAASP